jgi:formylglycine-generating enzyme required for sulfatase activity
VTVHRIRGEESLEIGEDQEADIVVNDQLSLEERGRGLLRFEDGLLVELFRNTEVQLSDARLDPDGFLVFGLRQAFGATRAELNAQRDIRLELSTELATATVSSEDGQKAEFVVCHKAQAVTCVVTVRGAIQVATDEKAVRVDEGEAVYIFAGQGLSDPICVNQDEFQVWLERERNAQENAGLGAVVSGWPQLGCEELAAQAEAAEPGLPSGEGMVFVEGGTYEIGRREADDFHVAAQEIELQPFWIDAYEVTNGAYQSFIEATGQAPPAGWPLPSGRENHPVQGITWDVANAYCTWLLKRLPTEAEWEVAGRGTGDPPSLYPWGNDAFAGGEWDRLPLQETYPVGSADFNASVYGVYDMVGNVWEWVGDPYAPLAEGMQMIRGGRYGFPRDLAYRQPVSPAEPSLVPYAGFRCAAGEVE